MRDEQYTPKSLFSQMAVNFDLDVCAPEGGIDWIPADKHFSLKDDALNQEWKGFVWMNPPYSKPAPWVDKFIENGHGIALLPMSKSNWSMKLWNAADAISFIGTMKFVQPNGLFSQIYMPVLLYGIGCHGVRGITNAATNRVR